MTQEIQSRILDADEAIAIYEDSISYYMPTDAVIAEDKADEDLPTAYVTYYAAA